MYCKLLNEKMNHYGFQYKLGLNIDTEEFNPSDSCKKGGLYFTTKEHLHKFFYCGIYVAEIEIPSDARVYADPSSDKWKADKLIITKIIPVEEYDPSFYLKAVRYNGHAIDYVKEQTLELCIEAVKQNGYALQSIKNQFRPICLEAIKTILMQ